MYMCIHDIVNDLPQDRSFMMTLNTAASGAGTTGTVVFIISSMPSVDMMPSTYSCQLLSTI